MGIDLATITATIGALSAGVDLIDRIYGKVVHVLTGDPEPDSRPDEHGLQKLETRTDSIVFREYGVIRTITGADLGKLPASQLSRVRMYEQAMKNRAAIFERVYPSLDLESDPVRQAQIELKLKALIGKMADDLTNTLDFLSQCGLQLDDHYLEFHDLVKKHGGAT
jgi:hypothetical protein